MAGTGKSTISRTVAQTFADQGQLGGSFFFKKGEGDRGNATRFFTTLAAQSACKLPGLSPYVREAIDADPAISQKALKDQFEKLILHPLSKTKPISQKSSALIIVIDALDECEKEKISVSKLLAVISVYFFDVIKQMPGRCRSCLPQLN
jgi:hypothetical protein